MIILNGMAGDAGFKNTYNRPSAMPAKIQLRRNLLDMISPAFVFDAYCGPVGEMHEAVWRHASGYIGVDPKLELSDRRRRFVCDNIRVMRSIDLNAYNIFDFDSFGSSWEQMLVLSERRSWIPGERIGIAITDGSSGYSRFGGLSNAQSKLLGMKFGAPVASSAEESTAMCFQAWLSRIGGEVVKSWRHVSRKQIHMYYQSAVIEVKR